MTAASEVVAEKAGSNRTFMELKFVCQELGTPPTACSNRTFMELKLQTHNIWTISHKF